jgi:hypothetical protein
MHFKYPHNHMGGFPWTIDEINTTAKVSYPTCNIERSQEVVHVTHDTREGWTYFSLVLSITFENNSFTNYHQEGKWTHPH